MMPQTSPSLSIIIPALNEAAHLPYLLQDLIWQKNIQFEVIVVDGGSTDQTIQQCMQFTENSAFKLTLLHSNPGRATQLNHGAKLSSCDDFLFLHADSRFRNASLLNTAQKFILRKRQLEKNHQISGHFPIRFSSIPGSKNNYYFYESKTHLNKADCINGDQGFWISKEYFTMLGEFDESLPFMEDAKLALKITDEANWITLPGEIETSARRFESEGFVNRQILNSFMCNFNAMGEPGYFGLARDVYKQQNQAHTLNLKPFLKLTHQYMNSGGLQRALHRWYQTGSYIASNAWQLAFVLDCNKNQKLGLGPNAEEATHLEFYEKHLSRLAAWPITRLLTSLLTVIWFYSLFLTR